MSFLARIFRKFRNPTGYVGRDLEGNRFFEYASVSEDPRRTKRVVKYAKGTHMLDYVSGSRRLAAQWMSWMTHTRSHPPTLEELQLDMERQNRIRYNAALIAARDREEQIAQSSVHHAHLQPPPGTTISEPPMTSGADVQPQEPQGAAEISPELHQGTRSAAEHSSPWKPPPSDEPHSWVPRTVVRRGG